jgi:hypothetical protein
MKTPTAVAPDSNVVFTRFDEVSGALLHLGSKRYYTLNETGCRVWEMIQETNDLDSVAASLHAEFEVELTEAMAFLLSFVNKLRAEGLVALS